MCIIFYKIVIGVGFSTTAGLRSNTIIIHHTAAFVCYLPFFAKIFLLEFVEEIGRDRNGTKREGEAI